ncbi:DUF3105 domain-containing protein [Nonomuraea rubra]|uniref:DUF3105 domain-containing protein n=1 Tax=Nonomuraea rubra TaxID=46180 RepID=UPI0033E47CB2
MRVIAWAAGGIAVLAVAAFAVARSAAGPSLGERVYDYAGGQHQDGEIAYRETPPVGGPHNPVWQNCGIYDQPIGDEHGVHTLEHGAVWITYRPGLPPAELGLLKKLAARDYLLLSPYPGLPAEVVVSSWNRQLVLDGAADKRLPEFIRRFTMSPELAPEPGAPCTQGTGEPSSA